MSYQIMGTCVIRDPYAGLRAATSHPVTTLRNSIVTSFFSPDLRITEAEEATKR